MTALHRVRLVAQAQALGVAGVPCFVVGAGRRLLDDLDVVTLRLVEAKPLPTGVLSPTHAVERTAAESRGQPR